VGITACKDEGTGPGDGNFSEDERTAVIHALQSVEPFAANKLANFAPLFVDQIDRLGEVNGLEAVGMEIVYDISGSEARFLGVSAAVLGWSGLDVGSETVSSVIAAGGIIQNGQTFTGSVAIGTESDDDFAFGGYYQSNPMSNYEGSSGGFAVTNSSFGGSARDCSEVIEGTPVQCSAVVGQMSGSFDFEASLASGTGAPTYSQPATPFSLPAVRLTITVVP
jgi:hypothetical protein